METTTRPLITSDHLNPFTTYTTTEVYARNLKPGMILVERDDPLGFAYGIVDHRQRAPRNSGAAHFLCEVFDDGYRTIELHANAKVRVAVKAND